MSDVSLLKRWRARGLIPGFIASTLLLLSWQTQMLQPPYDVGARASSNSWGAVQTTYTSLDRQMDSFAFQRPDMVIVVAAGNCGDASSGCQYQV